jgi:hypothetical protein
VVTQEGSCEFVLLIKEIRPEGFDWIELAQYTFQSPSVVRIDIHLLFLSNARDPLKHSPWMELQYRIFIGVDRLS